MKKYLVIQLARFGDLIQTARLVDTLLARNNGEVHLCIDNSLNKLAEIVYPRAVLHPITAHATGLDAAAGIRAILIDNRKEFDALSTHQFDEVYNLNFSPLNMRLASLFDAETVRGYGWRNGQETIGKWPAMAMRWSSRRKLGINLVDFWGSYCTDAIDPTQVNPAATPQGGGLGVVLAGRVSKRSIPAKTLAKIVSAAGAKNRGPIYFLGSAGEHKAGEAVMKHLTGPAATRAENLAGKTGWRELVEVVGSLDELITPDTGTMHLAARLGTPVRAFFLSSAWCFETGPYGAGHTVHQSILDCLPCLETQDCPYGIKCLKPYMSDEFIRFMTTGKPEHSPTGVTTFKTDFDALGLTFLPIAGQDKMAPAREHFRCFVAEHLGKTSCQPTSGDHDTARMLYQDKDWMTDYI